MNDFIGISYEKKVFQNLLLSLEKGFFSQEQFLGLMIRIKRDGDMNFVSTPYELEFSALYEKIGNGSLDIKEKIIDISPSKELLKQVLESRRGYKIFKPGSSPPQSGETEQPDVPGDLQFEDEGDHFGFAIAPKDLLRIILINAKRIVFSPCIVNMGDMAVPEDSGNGNSTEFFGLKAESDQKDQKEDQENFAHGFVLWICPPYWDPNGIMANKAQSQVLRMVAREISSRSIPNWIIYKLIPKRLYAGLNRYFQKQFAFFHRAEGFGILEIIYNILNPIKFFSSIEGEIPAPLSDQEALSRVKQTWKTFAEVHDRPKGNQSGNGGPGTLPIELATPQR